MMRKLVALCISLAAVTSACSDGSDHSECVPNETASSGDSRRVCAADGNWGPWMLNAGDTRGDDTSAVSCLDRSATYVLSYTLTDCGGACVCAKIADEAIRVTSDGGVLAEGLPSQCKVTSSAVDGCHVTASTECHDAPDGFARTETQLLDMDWDADGAGGDGIMTHRVLVDGISNACTYEIDASRR
jgi:hypothetical protein